MLQVGRGFAKAPPEKGLSISEQWHTLNCSQIQGEPTAEHPGRLQVLAVLSPFQFPNQPVTGRNLSYFTPELLIISFPFLPQCSHNRFPVHCCYKWP